MGINNLNKHIKMQVKETRYFTLNTYNIIDVNNILF